MNDKDNISTHSEAFGNVRNDSETFRKDNHTLTVRETQKVFEQKGVDITERSITNYCKKNKEGFSLLDCFYDENDRRHYITPESTEKAVSEVKARKIRMNLLAPDVPNAPRNDSEDFGTIRKGSRAQPSEEKQGEIVQLEQEILDLKITNKGKDYFIEQMKGEREGFINKIQDSSRMIGELKTKLLRLEAPKEEVVVETTNVETYKPEKPKLRQDNKKKKTPPLKVKKKKRWFDFLKEDNNKKPQ